MLISHSPFSEMNCAKAAVRFKILKEVVMCVKVSCALIQWQEENRNGKHQQISHS